MKNFKERVRPTKAMKTFKDCYVLEVGTAVHDKGYGDWGLGKVVRRTTTTWIIRFTGKGEVTYDKAHLRFLERVRPTKAKKCPECKKPSKDGILCSRCYLEEQQAGMEEAQGKP